jgi:sugar phosphate isomerase/epimerase
MQQVLISLSSFGAAEVMRHGQLYFARLALAAGADGFEVRGELLTDPTSELPALAAQARATGCAAVYSSPDGLWAADGSLDRSALEGALAAAAQLGAPRLKMSIGGFGDASAAGFAPLAQALQGRGIELVIENDQTVAAGTLPALAAFFAAADRAGLPLGMTFDMGNWHWTGESPLESANACAQRIVYVHCKGVQRLPAKWVAVPLAESAAPWRAVLRRMPRGVPWAIEYPLVGDDLAGVTRTQVAHLREVAGTLGGGA